MSGPSFRICTSDIFHGPCNLYLYDSGTDRRLACAAGVPYLPAHRLSPVTPASGALPL